MAKQQASKSSKGSNAGNGKGSSHSIAKMEELSEGGRAAKRGVRLFQERRRKSELEAGEFYTRINAGRSNNLSDAAGGVTGSYAHPGGNLPSMHFSVQPEVGKQGSIAVIRLESIQRGHKLEGKTFDEKIFIPCFYIGRFGADFRSRFEDRLAASTQELVCHYMADWLGIGSVNDELEENAPEEQYVETFDEMFARANTDLKMMLQGIIGLYGLTTEGGQVIFRVFAGKTSSLEVVDSTDMRVTASDVYIPVKCVFYSTLNQVTDDRQLAIYTLVQSELGQLIAEVRTEGAEIRKALRAEPLKLQATAIDAGRDALDLAAGQTPGKAVAKQIKKAGDKFSKLEKWNDAQVVHQKMLDQAISLSEAATGEMGYVNLVGLSGDLLVQFCQIGADKVIQVVHLAEKHVLRLAQVSVDTKIYLGQLLKGEVDRIDMMNHNMNAAQVKACNALIGYIRDCLTKNGINLLPQRTNLRLVKKSA